LKTCYTPSTHTQALTALFAQGNADFGLYRVDRAPDNPVCPGEQFSFTGLPPIDKPKAANNFTSTDEVIHLVLAGRGLAKNEPMSDYQRKEWGTIESTRIELSIAPPIDFLTLTTGLYAFVQRFGDLEGGQVISINRHSLSVLKLTIDTQKVVPFAAPLVGAEWPRVIQN
jgi:hypothetical protein